MSDRNEPAVFDPDEMAEKSLAEMVEIGERYRNEFEQARVTCAIIGQSGSGKSSLINSIAGSKIAEVGETETTSKPLHFTYNNIDYVDLPGCGTPKWPADSYISKLDLTSYDMFILNLGNRVTEDEIALFKSLSVESGKPCFVTRNFMDSAVDNEGRDNDLTRDEVERKIRTSLQSHFDGHEDRIYLISTRYPFEWDFPTLIEDITEAMPGIKKDRAIAGMAALTDKALERKREVARKNVYSSAAKSAASGAVSSGPLVIAGTGADILLTRNMCSKIQTIFGLTEHQMDQFERACPGLKHNLEFNSMVKQVSAATARYSTAAGVRRMLLTEAGKRLPATVVRALPLLGNVVGSATSFALTRRFGMKHVDECHDLASQLLKIASQHRAAA